MFSPTTFAGFGTGAARMFLAVFLGSVLGPAVASHRGGRRTIGSRLGARA